VQRFGKCTAHAGFPAGSASHDSTNALIFKRETTVDNRYKIMNGDARMFELYMPTVLRSDSSD
jgi:hypothetical protein